MLNKTKSRYKPIYKKFIRIRKNVQNKKKLTLGFLKKKKWKNLNKFLRRQTLRRKKNFRVYDLTNYHIRKYGSKFKRNFLMNLLNKQGFSLFYGSMKNKYLKKIVSILKTKSSKKKIHKVYLLINMIESRLDTVLYRSHFTKSMRESKLFISHGNISVNNRIIFDSNYITNKGDTIATSSKIKSVVRYNVLSSNIWPIPPENFIINYKIFSICIIGESYINNLCNKFPYHISLWKIINYYN